MAISNTRALSSRNARLRRTKVSRVAFTAPEASLRFARNTARALAPSLFMLAFAAAAHAQGSIDLTPVQTVATSIITLLKFVGSAMAVGGLIFAAFEWFGRHDVSRAVAGVIGAIVGAVIVGAASTWAASTTGQAVQ